MTPSRLRFKKIIQINTMRSSLGGIFGDDVIRRIYGFCLELGLWTPFELCRSVSLAVHYNNDMIVHRNLSENNTVIISDEMLRSVIKNNNYEMFLYLASRVPSYSSRWLFIRTEIVRMKRRDFIHVLNGNIQENAPLNSEEMRILCDECDDEFISHFIGTSGCSIPSLSTLPGMIDRKTPIPAPLADFIRRLVGSIYTYPIGNMNFLVALMFGSAKDVDDIIRVKFDWIECRELFRRHFEDKLFCNAIFSMLCKNITYDDWTRDVKSWKILMAIDCKATTRIFIERQIVDSRMSMMYREDIFLEAMLSQDVYDEGLLGEFFRYTKFDMSIKPILFLQCRTVESADTMLHFMTKTRDTLIFLSKNIEHERVRRFVMKRINEM